MIRNISATFAVLALLGGAAATARAQQSGAGDIPDSQVFVDYHSPLGFSIKVPEGWARSTASNEVRFKDHYDSVAVQVTTSATAPTPDSVKSAEAAALRRSGAKLSKIEAASSPAGTAVMIAYESVSTPNAVTGKTIRLENEQYLVWKDGKLVTLTLSAPLGADNVDQWQLMSRSFQWN